MKKLIGLSIVAATLFVSCTKDDTKGNDVQLFKGPEVSFQHGKAQTWYQATGDNKPIRLAVSIDDAAWNSLDTSSPEGAGHHHQNNVVLKFHPKVDASLYNHVGLGWNPHGHEPEFIYGLPHFDFHFYNISPEAVAAIPPYEVDSTKFKNTPSPDYFPPTYFNPGGGVPQMGVHWLDFTSPELNGAVFGQTFIYGSYDGKVTFMEPMITKAFIESNPAFTRDIPQPAKVQKTGYYPTKLRFARTANSREFILEGFIYRTAQ